MKEAWSFNRAVHVLSGEIELLKTISASQNSVRQAVMDREWTDFDEKIQEINRLGGEFACLDRERDEIFSCLDDGSIPGAGEEKNFASLIASLTQSEQKELSSLYRELKMEIYKIRVLNENFLDYLNEAKTLATAYISAVCPDRGGQLYTRNGRTVSPDLRSVVINNCF